MSTDHYLELSAYPVKFEAVSHVTNVFFDDSNKQVIMYFYLFYCNTYYVKIHRIASTILIS